MPPGDWGAVACSDDGRNVLAASYYGPVYLSHNYGFHWMPVDAVFGAKDFVFLGNGQKIVAAGGTGLFESKDGGSTWSKNPMLGIDGEAPYYGWRSVRASADGSVLIAISAAWFGFQAVSTNGGASWEPGGAGFETIDMSADGKTAVGVVNGGGGPHALYISYDCGKTWNPTSSPETFWSDVAISADGKTIMGLIDFFGSPDHPDTVYVSSDGGNTWNPRFPPFGVWDRMACSPDAKTLVLMPDFIFRSTPCVSHDGGNSWQQSPNNPFNGLTDAACSANGKIIYASSLWSGTFIYLSK